MAAPTPTLTDQLIMETKLLLQVDETERDELQLMKREARSEILPKVFHAFEGGLHGGVYTTKCINHPHLAHVSQHCDSSVLSILTIYMSLYSICLTHFTNRIFQKARIHFLPAYLRHSLGHQRTTDARSLCACATRFSFFHLLL